MTRTSGLYETLATAFEIIDLDRSTFLNAVCEIRTELDPHELLRHLKRIEHGMGRKHDAQRHGDRIADLDVLMFQGVVLKDENLQIPHPKMMDRDFVLVPCLDVVRDGENVFDVDGIKDARGRVEMKSIVRSLATYGENLCWGFGECKAKKIAIMNATPDSFSDGGRLTDPAMRAIELLQDFGVDGIDVGGESTRPGADVVSGEEELRRVVPVVRTVLTEAKCNVISIDTYKFNVAREALHAGATVVNDVRGGSSDDMLQLVAARPGTGIVLMHAKGDSKTMDSLSDINDKDIIDTVSRKLKTAVDRAMSFGIPRWRIAVDPGLGFAKSHEQSFRLLSASREIRAKVGGNIAVMIGHSRKRFLRARLLPVLGYPANSEWPSETVRDEVNRMATLIADHGGADLVRIHC